MTKLSHVLVALSVLFVGASAGHGLARQNGDGPLPVSPQIALADMLSVYENEVIAERVVVRVTDGFTQTRAEYLFRSAPGRGLRVELGSLQVWCRDGGLVVAHAQQLSGYVEFDAAPGQGALDLLSRSLPPIPSPQVALLLGDQELASPTPYTPDVEWVEGRIERRGVRLLGVGERGASLEMWLDGETSRMTSLTVNFNDDDGRRLELTVSPVNADELGPVEVHVEHRERATKVSRLVPFPGDSTEGRRVPPMQLSPAGLLVGQGGGPRMSIEFADHSAGPAGVYVFMRQWGDEASAAMEAARKIGERAGDRVIPVFVGELSADAGWRDAMVAVADEVGGLDELYASLAPELTIDRFSQRASVAIVRTDAAGKCTHLELIDDGDAPPEKREDLVFSILRRMTR